MDKILILLKKHLKAILSAAAVPLLAGAWSVFIRPQIVMAADLEEVVDSIEQVSVSVEKTDQQVKDLTSSLQILVNEQKEIRIDYLKDNIRELEIKDMKQGLSPDEAYQLKDYNDRLSKLERHR